MNKPKTPYAALNAAAEAKQKAENAYNSATIVYAAAESACAAFASFISATIAHNEAKAAAEAGELAEAATKACAGNCASCRK